MTATSSTASLRPTTPPGVLITRWLLRTVLGGLLLAGILFLAAGSVAWLGAWLYGAGMIAAGIVAAFVMDPSLLAERMTRRHPDQKPWDRILFGLYGLISAVVVPLVAGLDRRYAWAPVLPAWLIWLALGVFILGWAIDLWAMNANKYFAEVVRLQNDRGQTVVSRGPYLYMRHPGYLGGVLFLFSCPFLLGSQWSIVPAVLGAALLVVRTGLEDRMLIAELPGYSEYAARVRYRLLPGVW